MISKQKVKRIDDGVIGILSPRYVINEKRNDGFVFIPDFVELDDQKQTVYTFDEIHRFFEPVHKETNLLQDGKIDMIPVDS